MSQIIAPHKPDQTRNISKEFRDTLLKVYNRKLVPIFFEASKDTETPIEQQFAISVAKWLTIANKPYIARGFNKSGIWYAEDYVRKYGSILTPHDSINYIANPKYWNIGIRGRFHENSSNTHTPSDLLNAFFQGPTIAECASVLQACLYRAIEEIIGTESFNDYFGKPLTPFMITTILNAPMLSNNAGADKATEQYNIGNPLYHLFNHRSLTHEIHSRAELTESDVNPGDIIYMQGVDKYAAKHLEGSGIGWNLICVGKNEYGQNLYIGFSLYKFNTPRTYAEMQKIFIDSYNQPQSLDTTQRIQQFSEPRHKHYLLASQAATLATDQVGNDYPIVGIKSIMTIDPGKMKYFITERIKHYPLPWHAVHEEMLPSFSPNKFAGKIEFFSPFSTETEGKDFSNYEVTTTTQQRMLSLAKKFAHNIVNIGNKEQPIGLIMSGLPGIGKTHLCVAVAKYAATAGSNVLFIDNNSIINKYNKLTLPPSIDVMNNIFELWINKADLIVFDNMSHTSNIGHHFFKKAIEYSLKHSKAVLANSNQHIDIKNILPGYIRYDNPIADNFIIVNGLDGVSYRKKWWQENKEIATTSTSTKIVLLAQYNSAACSGVIIENSDANLEEVKEQFLYNSNVAREKIRVIGSTYISMWNNQNNMIMHDINEYDVFIKKVTNISECGQLLELIPNIHDRSKKIIVVTDNKKELTICLKELLDLSNKKENIGLADRIDKLFPELCGI